MIYEYDNYLVHFNQNHSPKNGQFSSGDGDGDGIVDDHHNQKKKSNIDDLKLVNGIGTAVIGAAYIAVGLEYTKKFYIAMGAANLAISAYKIAKGSGFIDNLKNSKVKK